MHATYIFVISSLDIWYKINCIYWQKMIDNTFYLQYCYSLVIIDMGFKIDTKMFPNSRDMHK